MLKDARDIRLMYSNLMYSRYITLYDAINRLPQIRPRSTKKRIDSAGETCSFLIGTTQLKQNQFDEMYIWYKKWSGYGYECQVKISPRGAKMLLDLYYNWDLCYQDGKGPIEGTTLADYIESADLLERNVHLCNYPKEAKESDFTPELFSLLFQYRFGHRSANRTVRLAGIEITKTVEVYPLSDEERIKIGTRRSKEWKVTYSWIGSDGEKYEFSKDSRKDDRQSVWMF